MSDSTTGGAVTVAPTRPAVVTDDPALLDLLLRLCAAANVTPDLAADDARRRQAWARASAVLVGDDQAPVMSRLGLSRRDNVVLVSRRTDPTPLWQMAVELRAEHVMLLPADQQRLIDHVGDLADGGSRAVTLCVVGGRGGAGASTVAAGLALVAGRSGRRPFLLDADPLGGGVELLLGIEDAPGLRWPEVAATEGRVSATALRSALPTAGSVPVLSWDATGPHPVSAGVSAALLDAARRGADLVVVDLPRQLDETATQALVGCATLLVVVPTEVRGVAAARSAVSQLRPLCGDLRVVIRELPRSDVSADAVAGALGLPVAGTVPHHRGLLRSVDDGLGPLGRGGLERACRGILDAVTPWG